MTFERGKWSSGLGEGEGGTLGAGAWMVDEGRFLSAWKERMLERESLLRSRDGGYILWLSNNMESDKVAVSPRSASAQSPAIFTTSPSPRDRQPS